MYPRSGTYNYYPQNNVRYGENVAYNRPNYGVTAPTMPSVGGASINYGENVNYKRNNFGVTAPTAPNIGNTPVFFGEATNRFRPNYGVVPPAAPNVGGEAVVFGEATNPNRPTYGITAPVLPAPRTQVNVPPTVPNIPVPQYNVPDRPIYYPTPTTYDAGNYPMPPVNNNPITYSPNTYPTVPLQQNLDGTVPNVPINNNPITYSPNTYPTVPLQQNLDGSVPNVPVNNNPITYAPNTYPQVNNTSALQPLPQGGAEQFNPYASSIPAEQSIPSTAPRSANYPDMSQAQETMMPNTGIPRSSPTSEIDGILGDTNAIIAQSNEVAAFTEQYTAQEEQMRQQQALQRQQQYIPPNLTQQYYQQSQAISNAYQQGQSTQGQGNAFQKALAHTLKAEGGYSNHPSDTGGSTMKGVTQATYNSYLKRKGQASKPVKGISQAEIEDLYYNDYWKASGAEQIATSNQALAMVHFDTAVNMGVGRAKELLAKSGGDANKYLEVREQKYREFASKGSQSVFLKGWLNRNASLRQAVAQA
ncbi:MAG: glycosyl hydrolase 108 family protein [Vampirovibrionales bacterium]